MPVIVSLRMALTATFLAVCLSAPAAASAAVQIQLRAPGWGELSYQPPAPGSYALPAIKTATDGEVLNSDSSPARLFDLMSEKFVLLSFIFTRCTDQNGCPLANAVLYKVQDRLNQRPEIADRVALLTVSFDPDFDTPDRLAAMKDFYSKESNRWQFLTTRNPEDLQPILDGYGQYPVRVEHHRNQDDATVEYMHLLRVYLIDSERQIRNIYSVGFLHPDILMNDLETLIMESRSKQ